MNNPKVVDLRTRVEEQLRVQAEAEAFARAWPALAQETPMPVLAWEQLERQLVDLAATPQTAAIVASLVSGIRKQASFKPPEMILREILCLAWTVLDEEFRPGLGEVEMT